MPRRLAGGALAGPVGAFLALPTAALISSFISNYAGVVFDVVLTEPPQQPATLVETGDADAYVGAWTQGIVRATQALDVVVIPLAFTDGISAFTSPTEPAFGAVLEEQLRTLIDNGMWATAYQTAFGFPPPWTTQEMAVSG